MSTRIRFALSLAPLLGALAFAVPAAAAPPGGGGTPHAQGSPHGDSHHDFHHDHGHFGHDHFGFGFGFWDPWWGWDPAAYWDYPYPYYYPYDYPPYPGYYAPAPAPPTPGQAPTQANGAAPPQFWYYCDNPQGYYPYVQNCSMTWKQVAATPPSGSTNTITPKSKP